MTTTVSRRAFQLVGVLLLPAAFIVSAGAIVLAGVFTAGQVLAWFGIQVLATRGVVMTPAGADRRVLLFAVATLALLIALVIWRASRSFGPRWREAIGLFPLKPGIGLLALFLAWPVLQLSWVALVAYGTGVALGHAARLPPSLSGANLLIWGVWLIVLAPVGEELLFRGYVFAHAERVVSRRTAAAVTSILFALSHTDGGAARVVSVSLLALALGWIRLRSGSLYACIALHAWSNLLIVVALLSLS